jgi:hypothetical protein
MSSSARPRQKFETMGSMRSAKRRASADIRLAANRAIAVEGSRGWRLDKLKQSHKIDVIVSLSMAALAAVKGQSEPYYNLWGNAFSLEDEREPEPSSAQRHYDELLKRYGQPVSLMAAEYRNMATANRRSPDDQTH